MSFLFVQVNALQARRQAATRATRWDGTPRRPTFSKGEGSEERATRTRSARSEARCPPAGPRDRPRPIGHAFKAWPYQERALERAH